MQLIDTHCHLSHDSLRGQVPEVLDRASQAGVAAVVCVSADLDEAQAAMQLAQKYPQVYCTAGVHPHSAAGAGADLAERLGRLIAFEKNVALGEIGLDYHYDFSPREDQRRVFAEQLHLAHSNTKPVIVHTREAFDDVMSIVVESGLTGQRIIFHSFTGTVAQARAILDIGASISFSGILTFPKTHELRQAAQLVPDDRILVETDAPYLSPVPVRKIKTNEPAHVKHVAACLAEVREVTIEKLAELTTANATRIFHLPN